MFFPRDTFSVARDTFPKNDRNMHVTRKNARDNFTAENARDNLGFACDKNRIFLPVTKKNARDIFGDYEKMPVTPQEMPVTFTKNL